jgi:hypothetical protein
MPSTAERITLLAEKRTSFDLAKMKRYFGEPFLLGDERMEDFDEYALAMASSLDPTDAAAHALTWQYIVESHWYMRLLRYRGHSARHNGLSVENAAEAAKKARTSESEAKSFLALRDAFDKNEQFDFLISQAMKRMASILTQLAMHRVSLAEALKRRFEIEERGVEVDYQKMVLRKEEELDKQVEEKRLAKMQQEREEKQLRREQMNAQLKRKSEPNA